MNVFQTGDTCLQIAMHSQPLNCQDQQLIWYVQLADGERIQKSAPHKAIFQPKSTDAF